MNNILEIYWTDTYKVGHKPMLPVGSVLMSSNLTPRSGKYSNCPNEGKIVVIGPQKLVRQMREDWDENFFKRDVSEIDVFAKDMTKMMMLSETIDVSHFKDLHALGYLPIRIKAIEEGSRIPYRIPMFTIVNTKPINGMIADWLVNYLETILSAESWLAPTSATLGYCLRNLGKYWIGKTNGKMMWFLDYIFHNFSMRGMGGKSGIVDSGLGFAVCSRGSDTLPVIPLARKFYDEVEPCINSVRASEHAIMCTLTGFFIHDKKGDWEHIGDFEYETFLYLLKLFPNGVLSLVMDTWDLWRAITEYAEKAKDVIMARKGKLVFRPDSGNPVDIVCGLNDIIMDKDYPYQLYSVKVDGAFRSRGRKISKIEQQGVVETLWNVFGGTMSEEGYMCLDEHVGVIYGDSINYDRAEQIFERLAAKNFAATNIVFGIGSYSLQYCTRDTHGFAQKATYVEIMIDGKVEGIEIFKAPITDDGMKKSAKGLLCVLKDEKGEYYLKDCCTWEEEGQGELQIIFEDGKFFNETTFTQIRERINKSLE